jgi:hypothetical protein
MLLNLIAFCIFLLLTKIIWNWNFDYSRKCGLIFWYLNPITGERDFIIITRGKS